jgi:hypothetical protein
VGVTTSNRQERAWGIHLDAPRDTTHPYRATTIIAVTPRARVHLEGVLAHHAWLS